MSQPKSSTEDFNFAKPHFGTHDQNSTIAPSKPAATTIDEAFLEYKQFKKLVAQDDLASNQSPGTPAFLISQKWLKAYRKFIFEDQLDYHQTPEKVQLQEEDHFKVNHPGPISNRADLCEEDKDGCNLFGTGNIKGFPKQYADMYIENDRNDMKDFGIINEELWTFLFERYGGEEIKRYYVRKSQHYTSVDWKLAQIPVRFVNTSHIVKRQIYDKAMFRKWWTQVSSKASLKELKERLLDSVNSAGFNITQNDLRLWLYSHDAKGAPEDTIQSRCQMALEAAKRGNSSMLSTEAPSEADSEVQIENNTGVELKAQCLEPLIHSGLRMKELSLRQHHIIVVEFRESEADSFAFKFKKGEKLIVGVCEWCNNRNIMRTVCRCKVVKYCNQTCLESDKRFHLPKCSAMADKELEMEDEENSLTEASRKGLVGLTNLGNTCYMNSSIQCIANTYELTQFFLQNRFKSLVEREYKNPLGTEGRIVMAWAKLIMEMWKGSSHVVRPDLFKRILGQYNVTFEGYGQHDSQECINTVLDFISEDLFKRDKKPYVEISDKEGRSDAEASAEAWNKHLFRNESIICDLFHGQFKSTLNCLKCSRISITFDPFLMVSLPIPIIKYETLNCYFVQYHLNEGGTYKNLKLSAKLLEQDDLYAFRQQIHKQYGIDPSSFIVSWITYNQMSHMFNCSTRVNEVEQTQGVLLLYQIPKELTPKLPAPGMTGQDDSNNGIDPDWVKVVLHIQKDGTQELFNLPRIFWAKKSWTLMELHHQFFHYIKDVFLKWYSEIAEKGQSLKSKYPPKYLHPDTGNTLTFVQLQELFEIEPIEKQFKAFFPKLDEENWKKELSTRFFQQDAMPYQLKIENNSGYGRTCHFCSNDRCTKNCPLPYTKQATVLDMLHKTGSEDNVSYYNLGKGKRDFILNIVWQQDFEKHLLRHLSSHEVGQRLDMDTEEEKEEGGLTIQSCFKQFKIKETLDKDNMWYCNRCKDHVPSTKQMEIYRLPPILIINLKRFKQSSRSTYGGYGYGGMYSGGSQQKQDAYVDFPLEGLDMRKHVIGEQSQDENLLYDCYAVSNHFGNMGFGHYTAYARNPLNGKWYEFDDSRVSEISRKDLKKEIVTNSAYNLFYRRRDWHQENLEKGIDFSRLAQEPDMSYVK